MGKYQISNIKYQRLVFGYTLIEILIVMSLIGLAIGLITTSYLGFERRQRLKDAVRDFKSNVRLAENNAHSGNKGFDISRCDTASGDFLIGWYVHIDPGVPESYWVAGYCHFGASGSNGEFGRQYFKLPKDVVISSVIPAGEVDIFYRTLSEGATFHLNADFMDDAGNLQNLIGDEQITVNLDGPTPYKYKLVILKTGEVNESAI